MGGPRAFNSSESASNSGGLFYTIGKIFGGGSRRRGGSRRGGAKTRAMRRASLSRRRSYRRRVKSSACRGKGPAVCRSMNACKYSSGKKRSYCRKAKNTRRRRGGSRRGGSRRGGSRGMRGGSRGMRGGSRGMRGGSRGMRGGSRGMRGGNGPVGVSDTTNMGNTTFA